MSQERQFWSASPTREANARFNILCPPVLRPQDAVHLAPRYDPTELAACGIIGVREKMIEGYSE